MTYPETIIAPEMNDVQEHDDWRTKFIVKFLRALMSPITFYVLMGSAILCRFDPHLLPEVKHLVGLLPFVVHNKGTWLVVLQLGATIALPVLIADSIFLAATSTIDTVRGFIVGERGVITITAWKATPVCFAVMMVSVNVICLARELHHLLS